MNNLFIEFSSYIHFTRYCVITSLSVAKDNIFHVFFQYNLQAIVMSMNVTTQYPICNLFSGMYGMHIANIFDKQGVWY